MAPTWRRGGPGPITFDIAMPAGNIKVPPKHRFGAILGGQRAIHITRYRFIRHESRRWGFISAESIHDFLVKISFFMIQLRSAGENLTGEIIRVRKVRVGRVD